MIADTSCSPAWTSRRTCGLSLATRPEKCRSAQSNSVLKTGDHSIIATDRARSKVNPSPAVVPKISTYTGVTIKSPPASKLNVWRTRSRGDRKVMLHQIVWIKGIAYGGKSIAVG